MYNALVMALTANNSEYQKLVDNAEKHLAGWIDFLGKEGYYRVRDFNKIFRKDYSETMDYYKRIDKDPSLIQPRWGSFKADYLGKPLDLSIFMKKVISYEAEQWAAMRPLIGRLKWKKQSYERKLRRYDLNLALLVYKKIPAAIKNYMSRNWEFEQRNAPSHKKQKKILEQLKKQLDELQRLFEDAIRVAEELLALVKNSSSYVEG